ncbi:unnamed protein product [Blepharisma stoltei]|uniref:Major facilitator superfamily (MFS) profile domain-containing protein n=1 Tax=Blepharisma stoltei TaxID=1481888 RepID=A0AAU9IMR4_9CILI|nr:unnamed protein product [Blepharisma stoltei]
MISIFIDKMDQVFCALTLSQIISLSATALIEPFLIDEAKNHDISTDFLKFAIILSLSLPIVTSPIIGKNLQRFGRRKLFVISCILQGIPFLFFSLLSHINSAFYLFLSLIAFIIFALGLSISLTSTISFVALYYPTFMESRLGRVQILSTFGAMIVASFGITMYNVFGFTVFCLVFGIGIFIYTPIIYQLLPEDNKYVELDEVIQFKKIIRLPSIEITGMLQIFAYASYSFLGPVLSSYLLTFNLTAKSMTLIVFLLNISFGLGLAGIRFINIDRKYFMVIGIFCVGLGDLFLLIHNEWVLGLSLTLLGFGTSFSTLTVLPDMIDTAMQVFNYYNDSHVSDFISGIISALWCSGNLIGYLIAKSLYKSIGFNFCEAIMGVATLIFCLGFAGYLRLNKPIRRKASKTILLGHELDNISQNTEMTSFNLNSQH